VSPIETSAIEAAVAWQTGEDERHVALTDDGWRLGLYRYLPRDRGPEGARARPFPVVLGHGLAGSRYLFDCHPDFSLARFLAGRGFDTWLVDLRGRNASWPEGGPRRDLQWSFDDFVAADVPAAIATACDVAGTREAFWLGTEMSGIALYAVAIAETSAQIRGGITMGAPAVTPPEGQVPGVTTPFPQPDGTRLPFSAVAEIGPRLAADRSEHLESSFRPENTDWVVTARYFRHGVPDEATELVDQFREWMIEGVMRTRDGAIVYSDHLGAMALPVLVLAGAADLQRPAHAVRATFDALGSTDKSFVRVGTADGFPVDAGHDDLVAGLCTPTHVFPLIADWLDERSRSE
jgi:lysosomal acid lipase/cholesteryl ester hydrolase